MDRASDLRVRKTKRALMTAMLTLLTHTPFPRITVNDLCAQAMVSRSAFYTHYRDKYDLVVSCLELLAEQLFELAQGQSLEEHISTVLRRISQDSRVFRNLIMAEYDGELVELIRQGFLKDFQRRRAAAPQGGQALPEPEEISVLFYASGATSAIIHWINSGLLYTQEEMSACLCALLPARCFEG